MFTVALIGADGSGKTTVSRELQANFPLPLAYLYMGINKDSSNLMLPTTYLARAVKRALGAPPDNTGPRELPTINARPKNPVKRALKGVRSTLSLANRIADEWFRQGIAWYHQKCGRVVLFDRHFFIDYYAYDIAPTPEPKSWKRRLHGWMLDKHYPKPHLVIFLDAPSEVLLARKGEGTLDSLDRRRQEYLQIRGLVGRFEVVDAAQPAELVVQEVTRRILDFHQQRTGNVLGLSDRCAG